MACGCNKGNNINAKASGRIKGRLTTTPRVNAAPTPVIQGMAETPVPVGNSKDRQRIVQLRKDAIRKSLGKIS